MLYSAFIFGLISSFHCIGMCGPIAMMLPVDKQIGVKKATQVTVYHLGRLFAYGTIGLVFGLLGKGFFLAGIQQKISIVIGVIMIIVVLTPERIFAQYNFSKPVYKLISKIKTNLGKHFRSKSYKSLFIIGVLNGFLPCGMVYVALFGAIAMQSAELGVLYMILFGLGTVPLMTSVVYFNSFISQSTRNKFQKAIPYVAVIIGVLFILRGLGLGIPYLSPSNMSLFVQETPNCH
ncbi:MULTISPECIES: sulfite exporter TauE/SafE family protein [unclassified Flavobacterium]|uniref:sulfite exporter TauE/SafE family protein n=1 Tax=unclassified Flavobacterium TaxID=196869 RepID=UPI000F0C417C|nr:MULTISPECIES: sulfite exporter TauE/SafE family protein [unclassified Flavobacterium]AYN03281.1 sulfite exporter TauE/SafE family protein [Flavobacterium sp. 140616W15]MCD0474801.1 sulfite exporter TauE/SafE family protein [Flavobacterium sp. EDS]